MEELMLTFGWRQHGDALRAIDLLPLLQRRLDEAYREDWVFGVPRRRTVRAAWPALNAFETKEAFVYKAEVPGLAEGDVAVYVEDETLILRGERKNAVPEGYQVHLHERSAAAFSRKVALPGRVDADAVTATLKDGVLTVTLPKAKETLPRQISVKAG
jgi:HSP20 family protein